MSSQTPEVLFASAHPARVDRDLTLPAKFRRLLDGMKIAENVKGRTVAVKMHVGGDLGYSTIHPLFVRLLVEHIRKGKPRKVFVTDGGVKNAHHRGYTEETVGAPLLASIGDDGKDVVARKTGWAKLPVAHIGRPIVDADVLVNFSHLKGHGDCGFGGACKNLAMGCVPGKTRRAMHSLEGKLTWHRKRCVRCNRCIDECPTKANKFTEKGDYEIFWHHCRMCMHCMLACPTGAIKIANRKFDLFQEGLARVAKLVLDSYSPEDVYHINVLTNITVFCDCWGLTTPSLVPDIGILGSQDIVAVDHASLEAIKVKDLIPGSLTPPYRLGKGKHLFEKLHAKDPYTQVRALERLGCGTTKYRIAAVK